MVNWRFGPRIAPSGYRVIVDRISQDIPFYRSYLKNAVLGGTNRHQQSLLVERLESPCCDFQAICAGASGYLLKKTPPARLLESLREAAAGGALRSGTVCARIVLRGFGPPTSSLVQ